MSYELAAYLIITAIAIPVFSLGWLRQQKTKDAGIVDVLWTIFTGFGGTAILLFGPGDFQQRMPVMLMVVLWGIRVSHYDCSACATMAMKMAVIHLREKWANVTKTLFWFFPITGWLCADVYHSLCPHCHGPA